MCLYTCTYTCMCVNGYIYAHNGDNSRYMPSYEMGAMLSEASGSAFAKHSGTRPRTLYPAFVLLPGHQGRQERVWT